MPDDDRVTAALEEIRQRHALVTGPENGNWGRLDELHAAAFRLSHEDAGVLLAALDAVLRHHRPEVSDVDGKLICAKDSFAFRTPWPCGEYEAITRTLLGEETGDA